MTESFEIRMATTPDEIDACFRLRHAAFLGGDSQACEQDAFDAWCDHVIAVERSNGTIIGTTRLLRSDRLPPGERYYSETEFDLTPVRATGASLLEIGRTCVAGDWRGSTVVLSMWTHIRIYADQYRSQLVIGLASLPGTDATILGEGLTWLQINHLAPKKLRPIVRPEQALTWENSQNPSARNLPPLVKSYLRMGACVGQGAWADYAFDVTDVLMLLDRR